MKKIIKRVIFIGLMAAILIGGLKVYKDYQLFRKGDGAVYKGDVTEDTGSYSTYGGNTANGSELYVNESGEVMVHFSSQVNRGAMWPSDYIANLTTGTVYFDGYQDMREFHSGTLYDEVTFSENAYYGLQFVGGKGDESYEVVKVGYGDGASELIKDDSVQNFMIVNGCTYYQYNDNLYRINEETGEEELVAEGANGHYAFHNETLYFTKDEFLYSMPLEGGEATQIGEQECTWFFLHGDRIYYKGSGYGMSWLMSMNLDGTNNKAHMIFEATKVGVYDGVLYYIKTTQDTGEEIFYIDLNDAELTENKIAVRERITDLLFQFYGENIEKRVQQFPASDDGSEIRLDNSFGKFEVCEGYILFYMGSTVNSWGMNEAFLYNIETRELTLLSEMLGMDIIYDHYLR